MDKVKEKRLKHKVFIVDDHPIVRQGLAQLINQEIDFTVCGDAGDVPQALKAVADAHPDIVIVDISLGHSSGIKLVEDLVSRYPDLFILILSMHEESVYAERCLGAGARGYIMKQEPPEQVISALKKIINGEIFISDKLSIKLLHRIVNRKSGVYSSPIDRLSNRELEVFRLIGQGLKTRKIAEHLNLSIKTIETYVDHIKKKMNFEDSRNLFLHAVQWLMNEDTK
ncbi:MAG TPA: response regulator transcription factor [Nitrospirae bacterium]|nr:response regulator transcription factor [Nitrospirota bacterium]